MHIEISTDNTIAGSDSLAAHTKETVQKALAHFAEHITRVEVHLSDLNATKGGQDDKQCIAITHAAATLERATKEAAAKMKRALESDLGRQRDSHQGH